MTFDAKCPGQRMVAFCTNVAETSLTVPGVRLVVDTGLAKEARYDAARRLNVIELLRVSRSSANQRMGRAGRVCEGACIRLYPEAELVRAVSDSPCPPPAVCHAPAGPASCCAPHHASVVSPFSSPPPLSPSPTLTTTTGCTHPVERGAGDPSVSDRHGCSAAALPGL